MTLLVMPCIITCSSFVRILRQLVFATPPPYPFQLVLGLAQATAGGGVLPYMSYIGMCCPKEYGFSSVSVIDRVSILAYFGHFDHKYGMVFAL